ncbi:MAG: hypothetical protein GWM90_15040 [Gemmatimonadetes bacterium]|nr:hypothetical protein [Gemmatimonadota bacterium]NIQ55503.1 hypothetical protein [Gemmatimonadota bacterium]NIU75713.1 hypothetical protein [Gammaproteobacteria bacterium]NIX45370.1 hypothetical protein [Gemmatimonadota bacterium]
MADLSLDQAETGRGAAALAGELEQVARWQGLDVVVVKEKGGLAPALRAALEASP